MKIRIFSDIKVNFINSEDILKKNVIYKMTFPNGKIYIGQTSQLLRERVRQHCSDAFNKESHTPKGRAIRKYLSLDIEVIYEGDNLNDKEIELISLYNSVNKDVGYNLSLGGNGSSGFKLSEETKKKISKSMSGRVILESTIRKREKSIIVTDKFTLEEKKFRSIKEAGEYYKIDTRRISEVLCKRKKTFKQGQYIARYNQINN